MRNNYYLFSAVLLSCLFFSNIILAQSQEENELTLREGINTGCKVTPYIAPDNIVFEMFSPSNNLRRKTGSAVTAEGNYVLLEGVVVDRFCIPVMGALVKLWQADRFGRYKESYQVRSPWQKRSEDYDQNFAFNGTTYTDNRGKFSFITIFPGSKGKLAPHFNVFVEYENFSSLQTMIFFANHPKNTSDPNFSVLLPWQQEAVTANGRPVDISFPEKGRVFSVQLVLDGLSHYRRY